MPKEDFKKHKIIKALVITLSDRAFQGKYNDLSGPLIVSELKHFFLINKWKNNIEYTLIPDEPLKLSRKLLKAKSENVDIVITTGGTGVGSKDFTPEVAKKIIEKELHGVMEYIRVKYGQNNPNALLSRSIAGTYGKTQLYCLPGSEKAVKEYIVEILKVLEHVIYMLNDIDTHKKH